MAVSPRARARARPDPAPAPVPGAGLWRRLGASLYDALLVLALWLFTLFPLVAMNNDSVSGALVQTLLFLELYVFFAYFWIYRGQTLGMLAWKLEIRTDDGTPVSLVRATMRVFALVLPLVGAALAWRFFGKVGVYACLGLLAAGAAWILVDRQNRSWADLVSGTRIIHTPILRPED